eukprot:11214372-Lingulodinium_polyedra.AAC.1
MAFQKGLPSTARGPGRGAPNSAPVVGAKSEGVTCVFLTCGGRADFRHILGTIRGDNKDMAA